jgi:chromosome segregation ATPase
MTEIINENLGDLDAAMEQFRLLKAESAQLLQDNSKHIFELKQADDDIGSEIVELQANASALDSALSDISDQLSSEKCLIQQISLRTSELLPKYDEHRQFLTEIEPNIESVTRQIRDFSQQETGFKHNNEDLTRELALITSEMNSLQFDTNRQTDAISQMQQKVNQGKSTEMTINSTCADIASTLVSIQGTIRELSSGIDVHNEKIQQLGDAQKILEAKLTDRRNQFTSKKKEQEALAERVKSAVYGEMHAKAENDALQRRKAEIERQFIDRQSEFNEAMEALNREKSAAMEHKARLNTKMGELHQNTSSDDLELQTLTSTINELSVNLDSMKQRHLAVKKLNEELMMKGVEIPSISPMKRLSYVKPPPPKKATDGVKKRRILDLD